MNRGISPITELNNLSQKSVITRPLYASRYIKSVQTHIVDCIVKRKGRFYKTSAKATAIKTAKFVASELMCKKLSMTNISCDHVQFIIYSRAIKLHIWKELCDVCKTFNFEIPKVFTYEREIFILIIPNTYVQSAMGTLSFCCEDLIRKVKITRSIKISNKREHIILDITRNPLKTMY